MKEFELINYIKTFFNSKFIGDDAFFCDNILITKDILIENIHFILKNNFYEIGAKSIIANVSDILAMGGKPKFFFMGLGIPKKLDFDRLNLFLRGVKDFSKKYNVTLGGGDISSSKKDFFISITLIGEPVGNVITRSNAQIGDDVYLLGEIGDSEIGLRILKEKFSCEDNDYFIKKHYIKELYPDFIFAIVKENLINSMIDISDGFLQDFEHILSLSNVSAEIYVSKIPISEKLKKLKKSFNKEKFYEIVLSSGEEYSLIFTSFNSNRDKIEDFRKKFNVPLKRIGKIIEKKEKNIFFKDINFKIIHKGFSHF